VDAPILGPLLLAVGTNPGDVLELRARNNAPGEEPRTMENDMSMAKSDQSAYEVDQLAAFLVDRFPVEPGDLVVLAVGVVVAALRAGKLVARQKHRHALREQNSRQHIAHLLAPES